MTPGAVDYEFSTLLDAGQYTIAFTCVAGLDEPDTDESGLEDPDDDTVFFTDGQDVEIIADQEAMAAFP